VRQEEGPPHAIVPTGELKRQVEAQLDKHIPTRQPREAPVRMHSQCITTTLLLTEHMVLLCGPPMVLLWSSYMHILGL